ncbi:hypothetical protein ACIGHN_15290 [Acidovorax sp. NPDC077693]|uniref:hypothetical protein n=1 Tax=unclassified Acidovorax TaxID=2684926 RepID=UPI0037C97DDB
MSPTPASIPASNAGTAKAQVKPNSYPRPGDMGNCVGCVLPKTSPLLSPPNNRPETEEEGWFDKFKQGAKDAAQYYKDNISESMHEFGANAMDTGGKVAMAGGATAAAGGMVAATGIGAPVGAGMATAGGAAAAAGGVVGAVGAGTDSAATVLDSAATWITEGKAPDLVQPALALGERLLTGMVLKKVPGLGGSGKKSNNSNANGSSGGYLTGGGRCRLRRYSEGCKDGRTPHHVVPDHVFKQPGNGAYYPAGKQHPTGFKHADGWTVCASGKTKSSKPDGTRTKKGLFSNPKDWFNSLDEHGKIHAILDVEEIILRTKGTPKGTTSLGEMEIAGVAAAAKVLGCDAKEMLTDLRAKHNADGLPADMKVRADPDGKVRDLDPSQMGTGTSAGGHGTN